ncbi:MAG: PHP domain-containing protein [Selenomonadaceae bacterium]|nr:PHP domain-containing protein [Selenomonadaceae bacterium]
MPSDLHTHTNFSDGTLSPEELLAEAKNIGLVYLSITDHDTVDGVKYLYENGLYPGKGIKIIPGVEFSAINSERDVHIVGYNIDIYNGALSDMINEISEARWTRFSEIVRNLQDRKYNIREADVLQIAGSSRSIGRFHIARALVRKGAFKTVREAFEKMLGAGKPAYAPRYFPETEKIIEVIHQAGGQAILAHPKLVGDDSLVEKICANIDGIEIFYPCHQPPDIQRYLDLAKKFNLLIVGGSDFHGTASRFVKALGEFTIADELAKKIYELGIRN